MKNPKTPAEWQEAVDLAQGLLAIDAARKYGLVSGGPRVDVERCEEMLRRGAILQYFPAKDAVERVALAFA